MTSPLFRALKIIRKLKQKNAEFNAFLLFNYPLEAGLGWKSYAIAC